MKMQIRSGESEVILSDNNASVLSYKINGTEYCAKNVEKRGLFTLKLLESDGSPVYCNSNDCENVEFIENNGSVKIDFKKVNGMNIDAEATVIPDTDGFRWHMSLNNNSGLILEWIEFPQIITAGELKGRGGDYSLFWPAMEGQLIEDDRLRENTWMNYREIGGQTGGYCGFYPGSCPMQFMAYYNDRNGLYFAAHDDKHNPKTVEFYKNDDGLVLEYRLFCEGAQGFFDMGYDMITKSFEGDWYDAAEIYRSWMEQNIVLPKKLYENDEIPKWLSESPVVVLYPIRGTVDHGDMTPNLYYPYSNILPLTDKFNASTESVIMALPMHWEGTAPWATPYVWPPYGGGEEFCEFVSALHEQGNLAGVYCSGIGWTTKSFLDPSLDFSDRYDESLICRTPSGMIEQSKVIGEPIRLGYDMCPQEDKVAEIVSGEVLAIAGSGCDYAQYFDQNLGGESCFCYSREHNHPPAPGLWQNKAMERIFKKVRKDLKEAGSDMLIGCEGAASEPFIGYLPFNDLRYNIGFFFGRPVPAYSYLFHEYLNNFMGNQNTIHDALVLAENPDCVLFRIAYSFAAGDLITVALGDGGRIHWGWDVPWEVEAPEQEPVFELIKNLNIWRRERKEYMHFGKMIRPKEVKTEGEFVLKLKGGAKTKYSSLLTSRWKSQQGKEGQIIVNFLAKEQVCSAECEKVFISPETEAEKYEGRIIIPPLSAVLVE